MTGDLAALWHQEKRKVLATLIRLLGDFDLAEEALNDAFMAASAQWPTEGWPRNPTAWLISAGRFRAIDRLRKEKRQALLVKEAAVFGGQADPDQSGSLSDISDLENEDDTLRLLFICCHPALDPDAQVALGLRTLCGLTTEEIARAFLLRTPTLAQRIVRAKAHIRTAGLRYEIPPVEDMPLRLQPVLRMLYLVFNEGYLATSAQQALRPELAEEALRLCRLLVHRIPDPEVMGLLGLMLCHDARKKSRLVAGELVPLDRQDRSLWDRNQIAEGVGWIDRAFTTRQIGPYTLQGAIAAVHATAETPEQTNWAEILGLYEVLQRVAPSPIVQLNRAVALGQVAGPLPALDQIALLVRDGPLQTYHPAHLAQAELLRQLGRTDEAKAAYLHAYDLCKLDPERRHLLRRLADLDPETGKN